MPLVIGLAPHKITNHVDAQKFFVKMKRMVSSPEECRISPWIFVPQTRPMHLTVDSILCLIHMSLTCPFDQVLGSCQFPTDFAAFPTQFMRQNREEHLFSSESAFQPYWQMVGAPDLSRLVAGDLELAGASHFSKSCPAQLESCSSSRFFHTSVIV